MADKKPTDNEIILDCISLTKDIADLINNQKAEIERLENLLDNKCDRCVALHNFEAVEEFAEMVKKRIRITGGIVVTTKEIDDLVKEWQEQHNVYHI